MQAFKATSEKMLEILDEQDEVIGELNLDFFAQCQDEVPLVAAEAALPREKAMKAAAMSAGRVAALAVPGLRPVQAAEQRHLEQPAVRATGPAAARRSASRSGARSGRAQR